MRILSSWPSARHPDVYQACRAPRLAGSLAADRGRAGCVSCAIADRRPAPAVGQQRQQLPSWNAGRRDREGLTFLMWSIRLRVASRRGRGSGKEGSVMRRIVLVALMGAAVVVLCGSGSAGARVSLKQVVAQHLHAHWVSQGARGWLNPPKVGAGAGGRLVPRAGSL